jgi:hypothetical protein
MAQEIRRLLIVKESAPEQLLAARIKLHGHLPSIVDYFPQAKRNTLSGELACAGLFKKEWYLFLQSSPATHQIAHRLMVFWASLKPNRI